MHIYASNQLPGTCDYNAWQSDMFFTVTGSSLIDSVCQLQI